jgi:DNA-binding CsgD family transcriptional regulator
MNGGVIAPLGRAVSAAHRFSFPPELLFANRRRQQRRGVDRRQLALAELANWLANRQGRALLAVNSRMQVLLSNAAAQRLLRNTEAVRVQEGRLVFRSNKHRAEVERVVREDAEAACFAMRLRESIASVEVNRIATPGGHLLIVNISCASDRASGCELLRAKLGLTRAEAEVATAIFDGTSLVAIAKARRASVNTVKTQVRGVFQKCRVHSQVALARKLAELMAAE